MDTRKDGWFGVLTVNGKTLILNGNMCERGSIMHIIAESLKSLTAERSRPDEDGSMELILRVRNKPIDTSRENMASLNRTFEVESMIEGSPDTTLPRGEESYEDYYKRLIEEESLPRPTAEMLAAQWFDRPVNPETQLWLNDPKAIRFRELNSRDEAYESALPEEYESLKNYVRTTYPDFVTHITFRTA
jgi:hypothetical protein